MRTMRLPASRVAALLPLRISRAYNNGRLGLSALIHGGSL